MLMGVLRGRSDVFMIPRSEIGMGHVTVMRGFVIVLHDTSDGNISIVIIWSTAVILPL